ncbi:cell wall / vacuolar inhibitor of fructosidase 2 [Prosopis cineraria]|uniref:cell wall / vacuolar inhibitor of fructosidase 2 n=1 Tax=Prosopis cineraria TaxID=364024 RepID=UPI002410B0F8|nr:cell wall / vacuolar inhibitor of fructosidase 2 [Prosopis cineraria]
MMASKLFPLLFLFLSHLLQPHSFVKADTKLIRKTCKNTKYYDLCYSSLKSDPTSPNADPKGLAVIMVEIGMANATATSSYLSSKLVGPSNDTILNRVLKECSDKYSYAVDALRASVQDLANEEYDYAYMRVTAASDYPNVCHNAFKRYPNLVYPPEISRREKGLKHICDVALGIIDNLNWY